MNQYEVFHDSRNVCTVRFDVKSGWKQWLQLTSDRHHDSSHNARDLELADLKEARAKEALIIDAGDLFDGMQGKYDPRRSYPGMRHEYMLEMIDRGSDAYFDVIADDAIKFYTPFHENLLVMGRGNHDQSIIKHSGNDPLRKLVYGMNAASKTKHVTQVGGYGGYVRFLFKQNGSNGNSILLKYFHGSGGDATVTKGMLQVLRQAAIYPDADIVLGGHIHNSWHFPLPRESVSLRAKVGKSIQHHIRTPGYNSSYDDGSGGWEVETGKPPKPVGSVWALLEYTRTGVEVTDVIQKIR